MEKVTLGQVQELLKLVSQNGIGKVGLQELLESGEFTILLNAFNENFITRIVIVDRTRTPKEALRATGCAIQAAYADDSLVENMSTCGNGIENDVKVIFFRLGRKISDKDLAVEYEKRGLKPDPFAVVAVNEADPAFTREHPNSTFWKDLNGACLSVCFGSYGLVRRVFVNRDKNEWDENWWFGGVPK